jgi:enoyl-CoA hydratase
LKNLPGFFFFQRLKSAPMQHFSLSIDSHIAHLQLSRPDALNTMSPAFWRELEGVLTRLHKGNEARVLVISSSGKHFSAGMSLEVFGNAIAMDDSSPEGRAAIADTLADMQQCFNQLDKLRIPSIAVLHGGVIGGAVDLASACCMRIASAESFWCIQEINIGMVADLGTLQRLPKLMPMGAPCSWVR